MTARAKVKRATKAATPTAASVEPPRLGAALLAVGGIIIIIGAVIWTFIGYSITMLPPPAVTNATSHEVVATVTSLGKIAEVFGIIGIIMGMLAILSGYMINTTKPGQIKLWSIIGIVASLISFVSFGGFIIGAGLGVIGGIIGLAAKRY